MQKGKCREKVEFGLKSDGENCIVPRSKLILQF